MLGRAFDKTDKHQNTSDRGDNTADLSVSQLVKMAASKDPAAMAALFERTNRRLYYYAYMLTGNPADAEDLLQEGFIKCILSLDTLQNSEAFYSWMWTVLRNLHANNIRKNKYQVISQDEPDFEESQMLAAILAEEDTPEKYTEKKELAGILRHMIHALPMEQREVILLRYYDELSLSEIAKIQNCPLPTVKSRLLYAKKSLRAAIRLEEEKNGVALHATFLIPVYPAILERLASLVTMSGDAVFSVFMNVAAFFGVACSGDTVRLLGTTTTDDHPIRDKAYVIRVRVAPIVAAGMALCVTIGFGAGRMFPKQDAVPLTIQSVTETAEESVQTTETSLEAETDSMTPSGFSTKLKYSIYTYISSLGMQNYTLHVGEMIAMQYYPHPYVCSDQSMELASMDESILRCEGKRIIGVSPGSTRVYYVDRNTLTHVPYGNSMKVTVVAADAVPERVENVTFLKDQVCNLLPGYINSLNYEMKPAYCKAEELWFLSDDPAVATYDGTSLYTWEPGETTIRCVRADDGVEIGNIAITVYDDESAFPEIEPYSVKLYPDMQILYEGDTYRLVYDIQPITARDDSWKVVIDRPEVLSFDGLGVTGLSPGKARIQFVNRRSGDLLGSVEYIILPRKEE